MTVRAARSTFDTFPRRLGFAVGLVALAFVDSGARASETTVPLTAATGGRAETGALLLRPPPSGRVRLGGTFIMGSTVLEAQAAIGLCEREPLGRVAQTRPTLSPAGVPQLMTTNPCHRVDIPWEMPAHRVTLSPYEIDRTEVTVEAYALCVHAGVCAPAGFTPGDLHYDSPRFPVTHVAQDEAATYCAWVKGRLPTEAEWEFAARGMSQRLFPWGTLYNPHLANHGSLAADRFDSTDGFSGLAPVGSFPDGKTPEGILDLAGNVEEWVADQIPVQRTPTGGMKVDDYPKEPQIDPLVTGGGIRVVRGGSYADGAYALRGASRRAIENSTRTPTIGFRCAASL